MIHPTMAMVAETTGLYTQLPWKYFKTFFRNWTKKTNEIRLNLDFSKTINNIDWTKSLYSVILMPSTHRLIIELVTSS